MELFSLFKKHSESLLETKNSKCQTALDELHKKLLHKTFHGTLKEIRFLIEKWKVPCFIEGYSSTILHEAAKSEQCAFKKVKYILSCDETLIRKKLQRCGSLPIHFAAANFDYRVLKLLMQVGINVDPNTCKINKMTCLHIACKEGLVRNVETLLSDIEVDLCKLNTEGNTPLHLACALGFKNIIVILKAKPNCGANFRNHEGHLPDQLRPSFVNLLNLTHNGTFGPFKEFLEHIDFYMSEVNGGTFLHECCFTDKAPREKAKLLLDRDFSQLNKTNSDNLLPIHLAVKRNNVELFGAFNSALGCETKCPR